MLAILYQDVEENCGNETVEMKTVEKKTVEMKTVEMKTVENGKEAQTFTADLDLDLALAQALKLPTAAASLPTTASNACSTTCRWTCTCQLPEPPHCTSTMFCRTNNIQLFPLANLLAYSTMVGWARGPEAHRWLESF